MRVQTLADYDGNADDLASFVLARDATYIDGTPGFVNSTLRVTDDVGDGGGSDEWAFLSILNNHGGSGQDAASYSQANTFADNTINFGQVIEARNFAPNPLTVSQVVQELDAEGRTKVITDAIAFGHTDTGIRILPSGPLGAIDVGIEINAATTIRDTNPSDHYAWMNVSADGTFAGIGVIGGHPFAQSGSHVSILA